MGALILGLLLFLGMHSARIVAEDWRNQLIAARGPMAWKALYTVVSLVGFGLIVWGYGQARLAPQVLWVSPLWTRHLAGLLMLVAIVLLVAAYVPRNSFKARLHHPMVLSVKVWALPGRQCVGHSPDAAVGRSSLGAAGFLGPPTAVRRAALRRRLIVAGREAQPALAVGRPLRRR